MKIVTAEQMRSMDTKAQETMPGAMLMENAGTAVARAAMRMLTRRSQPRIVALCGPGNNGGDGMAAVRRLALGGFTAAAFLAADPERLRGDAALQWTLLKACGAPVRVFRSDHAGEELGEALDGFRPHLILDALLGTGSAGAPRGAVAGAIRAAAGRRVLAVDIASGLDATTGDLPGDAIHAERTITLAFPKLGMFLRSGPEVSGDIQVSHIGYPWDSLDMPFSAIALTSAPALERLEGVGSRSGWPVGLEWLTELMRRRRLDANKGDYGHLGVVAGSRGMAGAPAMVARAAQRSGAGLVTVLSPVSAQPVVAAKLDEQMTVALPEQDGAAAESALEQVMEFSKRATLFCIGPGLTRAPQTGRLVRRLMAELHIPVVLDADGLNALAEEPDTVTGKRGAHNQLLVLTPHPGEAARLLGCSIPDVETDRRGAAQELAGRYSAVVLLKGHRTLIASPDGMLLVNVTGNPGLATGGAGDVLTGIVGGLLGQALARCNGALKRSDAAWVVALAAHLHGRAADLAVEETGRAALVAGDVIRGLPDALAEWEKRG